MTIKWKVTRYSSEPERIRVVSETAHFVTIEDKSQFSKTKDIHRERNDGVYNTFAEAKAAIVERITREISSLESRIDYTRKDLNKVRLLTESTTIPQEES